MQIPPAIIQKRVLVARLRRQRFAQQQQTLHDLGRSRPSRQRDRMRALRLAAMAQQAPRRLLQFRQSTSHKFSACLMAGDFGDLTGSDARPALPLAAHRDRIARNHRGIARSIDIARSHFHDGAVRLVAQPFRVRDRQAGAYQIISGGQLQRILECEMNDVFAGIEKLMSNS